MFCGCVDLPGLDRAQSCKGRALIFVCAQICAGQVGRDANVFVAFLLCTDFCLESDSCTGYDSSDAWLFWCFEIVQLVYVLDGKLIVVVHISHH